MEEINGDNPAVPQTGDPGVDAVLAALGKVADMPVSEHAALYSTLHDGLLAALNDDAAGLPGITSPVPGIPQSMKPGLPTKPASPEAG
ncbi:hypothetical protein [Arthrobacter caoxuetaonis]|uniref:Uncharacterized protein n=1 Tax=Arthrobacter caoxuetaonis TaxID=2886935 RepID=A0A9X1SDI2_9MICC|nr:hypothetical protein [Arthrobacter caoxuetaonis]MCC3283626.1 hypothetical protein [Arthrobacter caoxuetaonis]MCC3299233.1 hypothetical protein [Arthrobacter caoxuetaonis]USQ58445.1 hypothetical protein NF551_06370 [Arthrobacter caoxuetaonis]